MWARDAFWLFVDQKWKDSLKVAAAEQESWDQGADYRRGLEDPRKGEGERPVARKGPSAGVHAATVSRRQALTRFPPWLCKAFGDKSPEERNRIITDNKLCLFCVRSFIVGTGLRPASFGISGLESPKHWRPGSARRPDCTGRLS